MPHVTSTSGQQTALKQSTERKPWHLACWLGLLALALGLAAIANAHWPYRYRVIKPMLQDVLGSQVTIAHYHRTYFPNPGFMATGITLARNPAAPPLGTVTSIFVQGNWRDLILFRERVREVDITGMRLEIPAPGSSASKQDFPAGSSSGFSGPDTEIDEVRIHNSSLDVLRVGGGTYSFPIRLLTVRNLKKGRELSYSVDMDNPKPRGHIVSEGRFGPLNPRNLGATPLSGAFRFDEVQLKDIGDLGGILSSEGNFHGNLAGIQAEVSAGSQDFSVDRGQPTAVTAFMRCTINALNGNVVLDAIEGRSGMTTVHVQGGIVGSPKVTDVDIQVVAGRAQDVLRPFLRKDSPIAGPVSLKSHAHVDPTGPGLGFLDRMHVKGFFDVPAEHLADRKMEKELSAFSERAQKPQPSKPAADDPHGGANQSDATDVVSSLKGDTKIEKGIVTTQQLHFAIPGASVELHGAFNLHDQSVHLVGNLRMQSDVSHTATGLKSFLLKPLAPFFKKQGAGAVIPIAVYGKPGSYKVGQDVLKKK